MSIFIQEVLGLLNRNQKKITLDKNKDWFEFGKLYQSSSLNNKSAYTPKMDPFVIKWGDFICQATEDMTRTLPGEGTLGAIPVYTDPSGSCNWDTLKDSIITQNALNTVITIAGSLVVDDDVTISGCDLTSTCTSFNLLNQPTTITFGSAAANILIGRADPTSTVTIVGTNPSNACTNGALVVAGGVGIGQNLNVCGNLTVTGTSNLNGNVNLGNAITDIIRLYGILLDNSLNPAGADQVLIGQADGSAFWTSPPWMTSFIVAGDTVGTLNITDGDTLSILGGTGINTALSTIDTVTINHDDYGTPGTYAFPSSITTNAQGHITSITAGTGATITANNGLTMNPATNVQLGGTLIQNTTINNSTFDFIVSRNNSGTAIQGINSSSGIGVVATSTSGVGIDASSGTFRAGQFSISPLSNNDVIENTIFQRSVSGNAPGDTGIGQSLVFSTAVKNGTLAYSNTLISKFTSSNILTRTSEFSITGVNTGVTGDKLILSGDGSLRLPDYGTGTKTGTAAYNLSVTSTGQVIETPNLNYAPQVYASMLTQTGNVDPPSTILIFDNITGGAITFSWSRISAGLYELTCSQPLFSAKAAVFATPDINAKPYGIAIERIAGNTTLRLNCFVTSTGVSEDDLLDKATFKIEYYQ
jgi:hypothetical protein